MVPHDEGWHAVLLELDIAAYLTEIILLGSSRWRVGEGRRMEWDGTNMKSTNLPEAAQFVRRNNRKGWEA